MGSWLLGKLFSSGKFNTCEVSNIYSNYTFIVKHTNWLYNCLPPRWTLCGCIYGSSFRNGSWRKHRIMGPKVKQITLCNHANKCRLVWPSQDWSRKNILPSISSLPLCILQKGISYLNLCWLLCNSHKLKSDYHIINWITK